MPDDQQLTQTIRDYVAREYAEALGGTSLEDETPLISSGLIDSLSMVSLKVFLEQTYRLHISDKEATAEAFDSVGSLVRLLRRLGVR